MQVCSIVQSVALNVVASARSHTTSNKAVHHGLPEWLTSLIAVVAGWLLAQGTNFVLVKGRTQVFREGLRRDLERCVALDLSVSGFELMNRLAFPYITMYAQKGEYVSGAGEKAEILVLNVYYCLERFTRYIEVEASLLRERYDPSDAIARKKAEEHIALIQDAAVAELEVSLKSYARLALQRIPSTSRFWRWVGRLSL